MTLTPKDLQRLRWHLLAAIGALIGAGLLAWWSLQFQTRTERELQQTRSRAKAAETRLQQVRGEEEEIRDKAALFVALREAGILGPEQRLDWTEQLTRQQRQLRLPGMDYEFSPQAALDSTPSGTYGFYRSQMKLHLHLLHEADLLRFIGGLENGARALVVTRQCKVVRLPANSTDRERLAQLTGDCELDWITANRNGKK